MKRAGLFFTVLFLTISIFAGPFGLEFGWTVEEMIASGVTVQYKEPAGNDSTIYLITPTKTHRTFYTYGVFIDSDYGIYEIVALGDNTHSSLTLEGEYDNLLNQLTNSYGEPTTTIDYIEPNSYWTDSSDLIYALYSGERILLSSWYFSAIEGDDLSTIILAPIAQDAYEGYLRVEYHSLNSEAVLEKESSVL